MACSETVTQVSLDSLDRSIELLTSVDAADAPFLSCYLDLETGAEACREFLASEAEFIKSGLGDIAQLDFDEAYQRLQEQFDGVCREGIRGVALFTRSMMGGRFSEVIPSMLPFRNQLSFYRVPDIRPLLSLRDAYEEHYLLWAASDGVELLRIEGGDVQTLAWVAEKRVEWHAANQKSLLSRKRPLKSGRQFGGFALQTFSRVLKSAGRLKLVLAGDRDRLEKLRQWLPRHLLKAVSQTVTVSPFLDRGRALRQIIDHSAAGCRAAVDLFTKSCLQVPLVRRRCVTGLSSTLEAIESQVLDTLLITSNTTPTLINSTQSSVLASVDKESGQATLINRGRYWDPGIELSRLACQQGIKILVSNTRELFRQGGVGGLLGDATNVAVMPRPNASVATERVA
ncbi:MAG: hypothetical protein JAY63_15650 [Candidatus Thiodiazotropha taylori]|nr:hypothetical protein [Candidatus Thiodiazotropha taylori]